MRLCNRELSKSSYQEQRNARSTSVSLESRFLRFSQHGSSLEIMSLGLKQSLWHRICRTALISRIHPRPPISSHLSHIGRQALSTNSIPRNPPITKSFVSGLLLFEANSSIPATVSCTTATEKTFCTTTSFYGNTITSSARQAWTRDIHLSRRRSRDAPKIDEGTRLSKEDSKSHPGCKPLPTKLQGRQTPIKQPNNEHGKYIHLPPMPKLPHRPTKEELLAAATGFWSRLKVRFKWFSIRSVRPWNVDDWSAFVSWFVLGNIVWILVGTTTFFSLVIFSINTVVAQGTYIFCSDSRC